MATTKTLQLWEPAGETIEAIAAVLCSHWAAAKAQPEGLFWPDPTSWLRQQAQRLAGPAHHLTSGGRLMR
jgi:hypothetical protein